MGRIYSSTFFNTSNRDRGIKKIQLQSDQTCLVFLEERTWLISKWQKGTLKVSSVPVQFAKYKFCLSIPELHRKLQPPSAQRGKSGHPTTAFRPRRKVTDLSGLLSHTKYFFFKNLPCAKSGSCAPQTSGADLPFMQENILQNEIKPQQSSFSLPFSFFRLTLSLPPAWLLAGTV